MLRLMSGGSNWLNEDAMKTKTVRYKLDKLPPPLTKSRRAKLKALATRPDSEIDTSDIPEMTEEQWAERKTGPFLWSAEAPDHSPRRCRCAGLAEGSGAGLPTRINAIPRREMLTSVKSAR